VSPLGIGGAAEAQELATEAMEHGRPPGEEVSGVSKALAEPAPEKLH
jgi:hypothetical protein